MNTYTAFCRDDDDLHSTMWIETIEASGPEAAIVAAEEACADAWGYEGSDRTSVRCIGLAAGDIEIVHWND